MDFAAVLLRGEAPVDGEPRAARGFGGVEQLEHDDLVGGGAGARLERDGQVRLGANGRQAVVDELRVPDHRRAVAALHNARHRAAGVEVDRDEPLERRHLPRGESQLVGIVPEELADDRPLAGQELQQVAGGRGAVCERRRAHHLRVREVGAEAVAESAEGRVRVVGERREDIFHFVTS